MCGSHPSIASTSTPQWPLLLQFFIFVIELEPPFNLHNMSDRTLHGRSLWAPPWHWGPELRAKSMETGPADGARPPGVRGLSGADVRRALDQPEGKNPRRRLIKF